MYGPSRPEVHRMHREAAQPPNPNRGGMILNMENGSSCPLPSCPDRYGTLPSCAGLSVPAGRMAGWMWFFMAKFSVGRPKASQPMGYSTL